MKQISVEFLYLLISTFMAFRYFHNLWFFLYRRCLCRFLRFGRITLKTHYPQKLFDGFRNFGCKHPLSLFGQFISFVPFKLFSFLRGMSVLPVFYRIKRQVYSCADFVSFFFKVQSWYCYHFYTYTVFYFRTVLLCWCFYQKIKFVRLKTHLYNSILHFHDS